MRDHPTAKWQALPLYVRVSFWIGVVANVVFHALCVLALLVLYELPLASSGNPLGALVLLFGLVTLSFYNLIRNVGRFIKALS